MSTIEVKASKANRFKKVLLSFSLHIWCVIVLSCVFVFERVWIPYCLNIEMSEQVNHFKYTLKVSTLLLDQESTDTGRMAVLKKLNSEADGQNWQRIVFDKETILRNEALTSSVHQLLLQTIPSSDKAYGLWFNPEDVIEKKRSDYRSIELSVILLVTFFFIIIWYRRANFIKSLREVNQSAKHLAVGRLEKSFPDVKEYSVLSDIIKTFEITRTALLRMRLELTNRTNLNSITDRRLQESHKAAQLGCWEWQLDSDNIWFSDSIKEILSLKDYDKTIGIDDFFSQVHPADKSTLLENIRKTSHLGDTINTEFRVFVDSRVRNIQLMASVQKKHDDKLYLIGTCQDISERIKAQSMLQKLSSAINVSGSSVLITDIIGTVEYINPSFAETTGYSLEELEGTASVMLSRECLPEDKYDNMWKNILAGESWRGDLENIRKDGSSYWSVVSISPIKNEYNELTHFVIVSEDVSELKNAHERMEQLALYDELTGLPNRRLFLRSLKRLLEENVMQSPAAVMLLDLDNFKAVNDMQGHPSGDKLLIEVANRLEQIVPNNGMAARLGGDEFSILINEVSDIKQVDVIAKKLLSAIAKPFIVNGNPIKISTSIGIAWLPKDGNMPDVILKHADLAMYQAKEMGRNQYRQFTQELNEQLQRYIRFSRELPDALANGDFKLHFQPKIDLKANKIVGVEALVRWQHKELGDISPVDFIPIAENTGFIVPLGNWVFAEACRNMKALKDLGVPEISCAVNISLRQFRAPTLLGVIEKSIRDNKLNSALIEVEITESLLMEDVDQAILTLRDIQKLGIQVAIDDFGTGYSSFSYLKHLPINVLKVDRCFVKDIPQSTEDMKITSAIISMAHSLNLKVVAEGIETKEQQKFLVEQKCDIGQGYLFGRPMSLDDLKIVLRKEHKITS